MARSMGSKTDPLSLKRNILWNTAGCLFYLACQWLTTVVVVVFSDGFSNSGALAYAMAIGNIFAPIALYKIRAFQVSDMEGSFSASNYVCFRLCTIAAAAVITILYLLFSTDTPVLIYASLFFLLFKADESFSDVLYGIEQKSRRMDYIGKSQFIRGFVSIASFCVLLVFLHNLDYAIIGMFCSCFLVTLFYDIPHARLFEQLSPKITRIKIWKLAKSCFPIMLSGFFVIAMVSIARQYFGHTFGEVDLGIYAAIATPAVVIQASAAYLYSPALVSMAESYHSNNMRGFLRIFYRMILLLLSAMVIMGIVLSLVGAWLLPLVFGEEVSPYTYILPYVLLGTGLIGLLWFVIDALVVMRKLTWLLVAGVACFVCCVVLVPFTVDAFFMNGINIALIIASAIGIAVGFAGVLQSTRRMTLK